PRPIPARWQASAWRSAGRRERVGGPPPTRSSARPRAPSPDVSTQRPEPTQPRPERVHQATHLQRQGTNPTPLKAGSFMPAADAVFRAAPGPLSRRLDAAAGSDAASTRACAASYAPATAGDDSRALAGG